MSEAKSTWNDWNAHIMNARGVAGGGIYTHKGAVASQAGIAIAADQILSLKSCFDGDSTSITFGDTKFMVLKNDGDAIHFRVCSRETLSECFLGWKYAGISVQDTIIVRYWSRTC